MKENNNNQFGRALVQILKISRMFGVAPVTSTSDGLKFSRTYNTLSRLIITILNATILTGFVIDLVDFEHSDRARTIQARLVWISNITIIITVTCVGCYGAPARLKYLIHVLERTHELKRQIGGNKQRKIVELKQYAAFCFFSTAMIIIIVTDFHHHVLRAVHYGNNVEAVAMYSLFYIEFIIQVLLELQFTMTALLLKNLLQSTNDELQQLVQHIDKLGIEVDITTIDALTTMDSRKVNYCIDTLYVNFEKLDIEERFEKKAYEKIRILASVHEAICEIINQITKVYGPLLLLFLVSFFLYLVITPYYIITYLLENPNFKVSTFLLQLSWLFFHGTNLSLIMEPCYHTQVEMDRTRALLSQLIRRASIFSDMLYIELNVFYNMLLLKSTNYSPFGMFVLGRPLIVTILGAVTTYLVIIFQLGASDDG